MPSLIILEKKERKKRRSKRWDDLMLVLFRRLSIFIYLAYRLMR